MSSGELPPLIQQMSAASFYPHPAADIRVIQTHISYVVLAGEYAYKIKRPVNLGFLDFTRLEQRLHFCREELRLNRRGAPELYLEVTPITEAPPGQFHPGGNDPPVEYAVKMRRFPQDLLLIEELRRGTLGEDEVTELVRVVVAYHARSSPAPLSFGEPAAVRASVDDNYRHTQRFVRDTGPQLPGQFRETRAFTDRFFSTRDHLLRERVAGGRIRECHGDLHLGNICRWPESGGLLLFDCIEFSDIFRYVDVMYDVGFIAMDLRANGRAALATRFVNEYAERSGDWEGLRVLPLYICRQAYVRAKVNSLLWAQPDVSPEDKERAFADASRYYRLAWELAQAPPARLLLMCGLSGSGKTTVARELARQLGAIHLRSDAVRKHLAGVPLEARGDATLYTPEMGRRTYDRLLETGLHLSREGQGVILDATYLRLEDRATVIRAAQASGISIKIVHCLAPTQAMRERLGRRTADVSDATADLLAAQSEMLDPFTDAEAEIVLVVDTVHPPGPQLRHLFGLAGTDRK